MWEVKGRHGKRCIERCQFSQLPPLWGKKSWLETKPPREFPQMIIYYRNPPRDVMFDDAAKNSPKWSVCCFDTFSIYVFSGASSLLFHLYIHKKNEDLPSKYHIRKDLRKFLGFFFVSPITPVLPGEIEASGVGGKDGQISWRSSETL